MKNRKFDIYLLLQLILTVLVIGISSYSIVTDDFRFNQLSLALLSGIFIILGLREYKSTQKRLWSISYFGVAIFLIFAVFLSILNG
ncbi:DUF3953 domain-containing protein [Lysinibacillus telephonicus]|uniref:DUF3953 domain-containing protein n=1 Tax=Lysinibacillus telephonicus TaxID=1714840 RepID=A0A431UWY8_9BACI|nr:DUF3953 domain-containing protein [Lysinibacillus telephonicus]RTQ96069.1 DUF3953 domain-containing protein [Lysinibacillus telephonicus]